MTMKLAQSSKATLVIGGGGFIGAHLVPLLIGSGRHVTVVGRRARPTHDLPPDATYLAEDLGDTVAIRRLLDSHQEIIHLAYTTVPNTSFDNPLADLEENLPPTVRLFSEIAERGRRLVLVSSGGTVYGEARELPICEQHPTHPISPYGVTKLTLENYARLYGVTHGLKYVCVRPSNAYGVGQRPFMGQGFIATAIASVLKGIPVRIFGDSGTVRDYLHVCDLAAGILSALEHGHLSETYNLGTGVGLSNLDVLEIISPMLVRFGCRMLIEHLPERSFDVHANVLDSSRLFRDTGWRSTVDFQNGLAEMVEWLRGKHDGS
jgi:UDP-glucose 4-epimerase